MTKLLIGWRASDQDLEKNQVAVAGLRATALRRRPDLQYYEVDMVSFLAHIKETEILMS